VIALVKNKATVGTITSPYISSMAQKRVFKENSCPHCFSFFTGYQQLKLYAIK
jgi:hypothetical protein